VLVLVRAALAAGSLWLLAAFGCLQFAQAHTPQQMVQNGFDKYDTDGGMADWLHSLQSAKATCCNGFDGHPPEAVVQTRDGHYEVRIEGQWVRVPEDAVVTVPNKYRAAVVWYAPSTSIDAYGKATTTYEIRCFLPPEMY